MTFLIFQHEDICGIASVLRWFRLEMHGEPNPGPLPQQRRESCALRIRRLPEKEPGTYG